MAFKSVISSKVFIIGVLIGFLGCIVAGKRVSETFGFDAPFTRFNEYMLRDTNFFPTTSSLLNTVLQQSSPEQTLVLIGGNSILRGFGQGASDLWSLKLQEIIGDKYKVFNFGLPTGSIHMSAAVIGNILHNQGRKVIIVTNTLNNSPPGDDLSNWDHYIALEACYKGLTQHCHYVKHSKSNAHLPSHLREAKLAQKLNSRLFFNDLWNFIGYRYFFTSWTSLTYFNWTGPRSSFEDVNYPYTPRSKDKYDLKHDITSYMTIHNAIINNVAQDKPLNNDTNEFFKKFTSRAKNMLPDYLIDRTVIVLSAENPYILDSMEDTTRNQYETIYNYIENSWNSAGYKTLRIGVEIPPEEWNDSFHLAAPGGARLAAKLAPLILDLNEKLYTNK